MRLFPDPEVMESMGVWAVRDAVECGPTLVHKGRIWITDGAEHLRSPAALPRTFVAYSERQGVPDRLILCATVAMEYKDAAEFCMRYFGREHGIGCWAAMCLDGGGSTQMAYVKERQVISAVPALTTVPTAVAVWARR